MADAETPARKRSTGGALAASLGILVSKLVGMVRDVLVGSYLGVSFAADAFRAALRIPNMLQNLLGEGVLSASFIPIYARLRAQGEDEEAERVAGAVFGLLSVAVTLLAVTGVLLSPFLADVLTPGFHGETRALTILFIRILFPSTGILVLSAWCLGVLNSHRRFFLSYAAPVVWSAAQMVALLVWASRKDVMHAAEVVTWGVLAGSVLQLAVQLPPALRLLRSFRPSLDTRRTTVRQVLSAFVPVVVGRGVVQASALVDNAYASLLGEGVVAGLSITQTISLLPVSLFGMAVAASELPELSRTGGHTEEARETIRQRVVAGMERVAFFVVPSAAALLTLGDVIVATLYQRGNFGPAASRFVGFLLLGSGVGLVATTSGRLCSSALYALQDAKAPFRYAVIRVALNLVLGYPIARWLPGWLGVPSSWGAVGLTLLFGVAGWVEFRMLRARLESRVGKLAQPGRSQAIRTLGVALASAAALSVKALLIHRFGTWLPPYDLPLGWLLCLPHASPLLVGTLVLGTFGVTYLGVTVLLGLPEPRQVLRRLLRR